MAFEIDQIRLYGHYDTDTGKVRTANVYWVDGIDRALTIAELVMAICLERAATMEEGIIAIMDAMQETNLTINGLTRMESLLVAVQKDGVSGNTFEKLTDKAELIPEGQTLKDNFLVWLSNLPETARPAFPDGVTKDSTSLSADQVQALIQNIESKLDNLNSYSQQKMIELQSETNKRNQAFDLISSMLKSIGTANQSIGANYR